MLHRFGPTLLAPPLSAVWQAAHFLKVASPALTSAAASNGPIACGAAGSAEPLSAGSSTATISYACFPGADDSNSPSEIRAIEQTTHRVPSSAPISLLISKESMRQRLPYAAGHNEGNF